jgi:hypothetical protein
MSRGMVIIGAIVALGFPAAVGASAQTPFEGTFSGNATVAPCGVATLCADELLAGKARHLGRATLTKQVVVHLTSEPCAGGGTIATFTETATLTAANGDTIGLAGAGSACAAGGHSIGSAALNVTGGSGRFEHTTGTLEEHFDHNLVTGTVDSTLTGTLRKSG